MAVAVFQQGAGGYTGQEDTVLFSRQPDVNFGTEGSISPDQQDANGVRQGLMRFNDIIGDGPGQIPLGATINEAILTVDVVNDSNSAMQMSLYRMNLDWNESTATWNTFGAIGGVQASEGESSDLPPDSILFDSDTTAESPTAGIFEVTTSLQYWVSGVENYGWMFESAATNGWDFRTKESAQAQRPMLFVRYNEPEATGDFQILNTSLFQAEGDTGTTTAVIEVARLGDLSNAATINYTVTAGGAQPADSGDFVAVGTPATLNFGENEALATIEVTINGDTDLEGLETILVSLTGGSVVAGRDVATVTIADDDALINEVLANVTNDDDETDREYIELIGTPGASLADYYFVVFEGEEEENGGAGSGIADFVFDLSDYSFGSNGLLVIVPGDPGVEGYTWEYADLAAAGTTIVETTALMGAGGVLEDLSQTYALIRSPGAAIVQGTDYDTVGAYENATNQAIGTGVGILDQLPAGADLIDSVGVVEGGGGDRDRVATTAGLGHPGIHVHQPTPFIQGGDVTSDAVSRRFGQTLPNSIGAWFNGDISNGDGTTGPIEYLNDSFFISVVAPDGAVLTPGAHNILRTVFFSLDDQNKQVAEADGSVTLRIERTGNVMNEEIQVTYRTVDINSAEEDVDYQGVETTITLGAAESFKDIVIDLLPDEDAEGFERFRVDIISVTNVTDPDLQYLITNGRPTGSGVNNGEAVVTIADANVSIATFQNGDANGYMGTKDAYLDGESVDLKFGQDPVIRVDQVKGEGEDTPDEVRPQQGLLQFDDIFGDVLNQVPMGSTIYDAFLTLKVSNVASGADIRFYRMLQNWDQINATWFDPLGVGGISPPIQNGVTPDGIEASSVPDLQLAEPGRAGLVQIPLNVDTIQSWANGSLANFGWSIVSDLGSRWQFDSSEAFLIDTFKPELTILYTDPVETPEPDVTGTFSFSVDNYTVSEIGGTATITVNRIGGSDGMATVNWSVTAGTGDLLDITGPAGGQIVFNEGDLFKTFNVGINNDTDLERTETLNLTLSGLGLEFDRSEATLTIRDNDFVASGADLLLSEIWINSPGNDPPHEFVELSGAAGIALGSLYYVAIEGLVGDHEGTAEKVVDLGEYFNGSNGHTLITPDAADFAFRIPDGATQIDKLGSIGQENVASQNDSTTYMLIYSPFVALTESSFDYDWNNNGSLDLLSLPGVQIIDSVGVRVLGDADQLYGPETNRTAFSTESDPEVDAITRFRGNTQRNEGDAWYGGDLFPAGDDYLLYEPAESFFLPVEGAAMTPGELNTGTAAQSPLVSLVSVTPNLPVGTVTVTFSGIVSQLNAGDGGAAGPGGAGITITDTDGDVIPDVNIRPMVTGLGTDTLTLSFTGSGVVGGLLPAGDYQLNFVGNGLIANGRAVDANGGAPDPAGSDFAFEFTQSQIGPELPGDYNQDGTVDAADYTVWRDTKNANVTPFAGADGSGNGVIDQDDYIVWRNNFGMTLPPASAAAEPLGQGSVVAADAESSEADSVSSDSLDAVFGALGGRATQRELNGLGRRGTGDSAAAGQPSNSLLLLINPGIEEALREPVSNRVAARSQSRFSSERGNSFRETFDAAFASLADWQLVNG